MICSKRWPVGLVQLSVTGLPGVSTGALAVQTVSASGRGDALAGPAEAGEIGVAARRPGDSSRTGGELRSIVCALAQQHEVVDARALEVDRAREARRLDPRRAAFRASTIARLCSRARPRRRRGLGLRLRRRAWPCRSRPCASAGWRREECARTASSSRAAPARSARRRGSCSYCRSLRKSSKLMVPGRGPWPPQGWQRKIRLSASQPPVAAP